MLSQFPKFKPLDIDDREEIRRITQRHPPYSDFDFVSLWSWNVHNKMLVSKLHDNLVVLFSDYVSEKHFLSFIGENRIVETVSELIDFSKKHYHTDFLRLVPEELTTVLPGDIFKIETDRDSYDYIYSVSHLANMNNWSKNSSGKRIRKFIRSNPTYVVKQLPMKDVPKEE